MSEWERPSKLDFNESTYHANEYGGYSNEVGELSSELEARARDINAYSLLKTMSDEELSRISKEKEDAFTYKEQHGAFPSSFDLEKNEKAYQNALDKRESVEKAWSEDKGNSGFIGVVIGVVLGIALLGSNHHSSNNHITSTPHHAQPVGP
jgi:hypothetical protein